MNTNALIQDEVEIKLENLCLLFFLLFSTDKE